MVSCRLLVFGVVWVLACQHAVASLILDCAPVDTGPACVDASLDPAWPSVENQRASLLADHNQMAGESYASGGSNPAVQTACLSAITPAADMPVRWHCGCAMCFIPEAPLTELLHPPR